LTNFEQINKSTPNVSEFVPLPQQLEVIKYVRKFDYSQGTLEVLLSGSIGCLREDALIETTSGQVPISDIKKSHWLLSFDHKNNQFCFVQGSDAFPKGKDYLYQVTTNHGEFVASGHHHICTYPSIYRSVEDLFLNGYEDVEALNAPQMKHPSFFQKLFLSSVLSSWKTISSFLYHCVKHIHQCDQQLHSDLNIVQDAFPLQDDALVFDQFFYKNKLSCVDDLRVLELKHAHLFEKYGHKSMHDLFLLLERKIGDEVNVDFQAYSKLLLHKFEGIQQWMISDLSNAHPKALLFVCAKLCRLLILSLSSYYSESSTNTTIKSIVKLNKQEWYWDIQVPNTNNYISNGLIHHNSSKSITLAHLAITHCLMHPRARFGIGRLALPQLKATLCKKIYEHLESSGVDFTYNTSSGDFKFSNKSEIKAVSWSDGNYTKLGSYEFSSFAIEELTESKDMSAYDVILQRVGRVPHIKENFIISATNPSGPTHPAYKKLIMSRDPKVKVFYSKTEDNPYLPKSYIEGLRSRLDKKQAMRMLEGLWIDINTEVIYHEYDPVYNYRDYEYKVNPNLPIYISFDFNVGHKKPMSVCISQYDHVTDTFHFFDEVVVEGIRTLNAIEEIANRRYFDFFMNFIVHGDATGKANTTNSKLSNYEIIESFLANYKRSDGRKINFKLDVPRSNPPIRTRHETVNGYLCNSKKERRVFVYKQCPTLDEGFRLTKLKEKSGYIEDDSKPYQHITTAAGYHICQVASYLNYDNLSPYAHKK